VSLCTQTSWAGRILKQKKLPKDNGVIRDINEVDPQDGYDVISTIDVYIQDIAHHALLKQLEDYEADHGCVCCHGETETGHVKGYC
jgi:cell division protein FtsI (penicillin-binding protein 3)